MGQQGVMEYGEDTEAESDVELELESEDDDVEASSGDSDATSAVAGSRQPRPARTPRVNSSTVDSPRSLAKNPVGWVGSWTLTARAH